MPDHSTQSSYQNVTVDRTAISARIDWEKQVFSGVVTYTLTTTKTEVRLDASFLNIDEVRWQNRLVPFELLPRSGFQGQALVISDVPVKTCGRLDISFQTTSECTGLQWLGPEQTIGKQHPFLFSQCEPIHARSIFPCFDTPSIKTPFDIRIESEHPVLTTGILDKKSTNGVYEFVQKVPIPSYLFALASGNLVGKSIGPRSTVWAEPELVDECQWEFSADTEKQLSAAETLVFPYEWGTYDVLVLPPSFPFGGMENPNITFATPTLIAGDRTLVNVIAHELAHSWSGNLVTNANWSHFWLNEGWTVYLERRILGLINGEAYRHFAAIEGWADLQTAVKEMPAEYTKLRLNVTSEIDPDDTFSTIPYEKGSTFLWYLETLVGREAWDKFIPQYFTKYKYKSLTTDDFINTLYEHLDNKKLDEVDWDLWLNTAGLPPKPEFNDELAVPCLELAKKWISDSANDEWKKWASPKDTEGWNALQTIVFMNEILAAPATSLNLSSAQAIGSLYKINQAKNAELKFRWLQLAVRAGSAEETNELARWLGTVGRMKYVRPGYMLLDQVDPRLARETFDKNKSFYHSICRNMVEKDLQRR